MKLAAAGGTFICSRKQFAGRLTVARGGNSGPFAQHSSPIKKPRIRRGFFVSDARSVRRPAASRTGNSGGAGYRFGQMGFGGFSGNGSRRGRRSYRAVGASNCARVNQVISRGMQGSPGDSGLPTAMSTSSPFARRSVPSSRNSKPQSSR